MLRDSFNCCRWGKTSNVVELYSGKNSLKEESGDNLYHALRSQGHCEHKRYSRKFM